MDTFFNYFKSEADAYIFILAYTDAKNRCRLLGIRKYHYLNSNLATEWRDNIYNIITNRDPELSSMNVNDLQKALNILDDLYRNMIEE